MDDMGNLVEERLERGQLLVHSPAPFDLPRGDDIEFLLHQRLGLGHKNISLDPATGRITGCIVESGRQASRLIRLLSAFSHSVLDWLNATLPCYAPGLHVDRATFRPLEEATRRLRPTARNDVLHIDAFPTRPSGGRRILRVFANINPIEPRVWITSEPFGRLLEKFGHEVGLPGRAGPHWLKGLGQRVLGVFHSGRSPYDAFMLRFHDFIKSHEGFQRRAPKRRWTFPPNSAWMAMTDACTYAELRGQFALEHSFFVDQDVLALPHEAPIALLRHAGAPCRKDIRAA
jgi:hypothetical protein